MIPKQLFFIWFGDTKPNYVDFSIKSFKDVNPDFKVNLLRYTVSNIENMYNVSKYDHNVYTCLDSILSKEHFKYKNAILEYKGYNRKVLQILANIVRLDLLNEYGGIYLDCDTFPVKPFDEWILNNNSFCSYTFTSDDPYHRKKDCHFIGNDNSIHKMNTYYEAWEYMNVNEYNFQLDIDWNNRRKLFFNCMLDYNVKQTEYYIEHFVDRTWKKDINNKIRTPLCKYDNM